jgi:protein ImuB
VQVDLYEPSCSAESLLDLIHLHLERYQQRELLAGAIEEISVAARRWVPLGERQRLLFDEDPKPNQQALAGLVNRLVIRLGAHQVLRPLSVSGVQPEYARRYRSWVGGATRNSAREPREVFQGLMARPLQMVSQPLPLRVSPPGDSPAAASNSMPSAAVPSSPAAEADAAGIVYPPATLIGDDRVYNIQQWWGPERIETGWWRGRPVRRDYWRIECGDRCQYWIFYDLQKRQWYLQGWF